MTPKQVSAVCAITDAIEDNDANALSEAVYRAHQCGVYREDIDGAIDWATAYYAPKYYHDDDDDFDGGRRSDAEGRL